MKANERVVERINRQHLVGPRQVATRVKEVSSVLVSMMATGCCHTQMSRPRTHQGVTYRVCLDCGMQRRFNPQTWTMYGPFSYRLMDEAPGGPGFRPPSESGAGERGERRPSVAACALNDVPATVNC